jgi:hypothetical protein
LRQFSEAVQKINCDKEENIFKMQVAKFMVVGQFENFLW